VGALNTLVYYAVYLILLWLGMWYLAAATIATAVGIINSYGLNKTFTFHSKAGRAASRAEKLRFIAVYFVQYLVNIASIWVFVNLAAFPAGIAGLPSLGISVAISFLGHKYWTFR